MPNLTKQFSCVRQSEHHQYAYVEDRNGVFARFYGPDANKNMRLFINAYTTDIPAGHYQCLGCGADLGYGDPDHKCSRGAQ